jgi:multiple sugar transport system substrate-binding protein
MVKKTALILTGTLAGGALLAGCGSAGSTASGPVNITYSTFTTQRYGVLQHMVAQFNKSHKNIHVTLEHEPGSSSMLTKLLTELSTGTAPNVVEQYGAFTDELAHNPGIISLDSFMKKSHYSTQGFYKYELQAATIDGKFYGFSIDGGPTETQELFYNKTIFQKYHVPYPSPNWTWSQLLHDAQLLNHPSQKIYGYLTFIGTTEGVSTRFYPYLWNAGGHIMNSTDTKATFDSAAGVKALTFLVNLEKYSDVVARSEYETAFAAGHVAMTITGGWELSSLGHIKYGVVPMPALTPGGPQWSPVGPDFNLITKSTPAKEQASWTFLQYLESPSSAALLSADGNAPVRQVSPTQYPAYAKTLQQYPVISQMVTFGGKWGRLVPSFSAYSQVSLDVAQATEAAFLHKMSPAAALKYYANQANQQLSQGSTSSSGS